MNINDIIDKHYRIIKIYIFLITICICSCSPYSKKTYLYDFHKFIQKVELDNNNYTTRQWSEADILYEKFADEYYNEYRDDLTDAEKIEIGKIKNKYIVIKLKKKSKVLINQTKDVIEQAKAIINSGIDQQSSSQNEKMD